MKLIYIKILFLVIGIACPSIQSIVAVEAENLTKEEENLLIHQDNKKLAKFVINILQGPPGVDESMVVRTMNLHAPRYVKSLSTIPTIEELDSLYRWVRLFDLPCNQSPSIQVAITEFVKAHTDVLQFLKYFLVYSPDEYNTRRPQGLSLYINPEHPIHQIARLNSSLLCEGLLALAREETDSELAYIFARWGEHVAYCQTRESVDELRGFQRTASDLKEKKQSREWGDYEHNSWQTNRDEKKVQTIEEVTASICRLEALLPRLKDAHSAFYEIIATKSHQLALAPTFKYGSEETYRQTWFKRSAIGYQKAGNVAKLMEVWPKIRSYYEGIYATDKDRQYGPNDDIIKEYKEILAFLSQHLYDQWLQVGRQVQTDDLWFLTEGHFIRQSGSQIDPSARLSLLLNKANQANSLLQYFSVNRLYSLLIFQAHLQLYKDNPSPENQSGVLKGYEKVFDAHHQGWLHERGTPVRLLGDFLEFIRPLPVTSLPQPLLTAVVRCCDEGLSATQGPLYEQLSVSDISKLRSLYIRSLLSRIQSDTNALLFSSFLSAALPLDHLAREVLNLRALTRMGYDIQLLRAKKLYELALKEVDPDIQLLLYQKAKIELHEMYCQLAYDREDMIHRERGSFLTKIARWDAIYRLKPKQALQKLNESDAKTDSAENQSPVRDFDVFLDVQNGHQASKNILSRCEEEVPEAKALKKAYQVLTRSQRQEAGFEECYHNYSSALKSFCDVIWGLRDSVNRSLLQSYLSFATRAQGEDQALWQIRSIIFASKILNKSFTSQEFDALKNELRSQLKKSNPELNAEQVEEQIRGAMFHSEWHSQVPVVIDGELLNTLAAISFSLLKKKEANDVPKTLVEELQKALPENIAQVGTFILKPSLKPAGSIAYLAAQLALRQLIQHSIKLKICIRWKKSLRNFFKQLKPRLMRSLSYLMHVIG